MDFVSTAELVHLFLIIYNHIITYFKILHFVSETFEPASI
jgi:hypothetical protein